jgi:hypothetical protein
MNISPGAMYAAARAIKPEFNLDRICFPEQLAFIRDPEPFVTADCSRRAGKTEVCALDLLDTAIKRDGVVCLYITMTRMNASRIIWPTLKRLNTFYGLGGTPNEAELSLTFENGSVIYLSGCKDKSELDKFRGLAIALVYIDEVQSFRSFIAELVDDVLGPALADYAGKLKLIGTPALLKSGFFWQSINSKAYAHHHWTFWQNPFIAAKSGLTHRQILDRELKRRGVSETHPSVQREWFGQWVIDTESLVLHYSDRDNHFGDLPILTDYVVAVDIGHDDADAIAVIGWHKNFKQCYLVEEHVQAQQGITELADQIEKAYIKYAPLKIVMDTGGLGKKIALELQKRRELPIVAAEKSRKIEFLALLDDALRTKQFFARSTSRFAQDSYIVEWDHDKTTPEKKVIKDDPHSDIIDAVLYGYREALHWLSVPEKVKADPRSRDQWIKHTENLMNEQLEREIQAQKAEENSDDFFQQTMAQINDENPLRHFLNKRRA